MTTEKNTQVANVTQEKTIADQVLNRLSEMEKQGGIVVPPNYVPGNALKMAWLILKDTKDKDKRPVLEVCSKESISEALLTMCIQGLDASQKHGSFIAYGGRLNWQKEYSGNILLAKRVGMKDVNANVIYSGDEFEFEVDINIGVKRLSKHTQKLENINPDKIIGAYAITIMEDGSKKLEVMNMEQIQKSWAQGQMKGDGPVHKNFKDQMCLKTVINRATKLIIRSSSHAYLMEFEEKENRSVIDVVHEEIEENANRVELTMGTVQETIPVEMPVTTHEKEPVSSTNTQAQMPLNNQPDF